MFRPVRWRSDKNKIKVVFKFQFHATQVTQLNVDSLVVSVVPGEVGKPTGRSEKATIKDGSCKWEYPVYETVKFNQDSKTGKITERIYHFVLSTGSAKSCVVGEASIDLAAYTETAKVSSVSLPLKNSKTNAVLHVSIQKLRAEEEENEVANIKPRNTTLNTLFINDENDESIKKIPNGDVSSATNDNAEPNGVSTVTSGSDVTVTSSGVSSGLNTPRDNQSTPVYGGHQQPQYEWSVDSDPGLSIDGSTNSSNMGERSQQSTDAEVEKLKGELVAMARQIDLSDLELQTLRKQIVKESKRGHDLSRELKGLKEERDAIHAECEQLKVMQKGMEEAKVKNKSKNSEEGGGDPWLLIGEIRQELYYEKDRNANLQLQLQKTQDSNAELLLALKELDEMLAQKGTTETPNVMNDVSKSGSSDDDEDQKALEELVKQHSDTRETYMLEQKILDLGSEIEIYRREKDELEMQMEQLALDYEILKQENHEISYKLEQSQLQEQLNMQYEECSSPNANGRNTLESQIERLEDELKDQGLEYSISLDTIKELQNHIKIVEDELNSERERTLQHECSPDPAIVKELEDRIESLEAELRNQREVYSGSMTTINELQNHIKSLEEEIKTQEQSIQQHEAATANTKEELKAEIERLENELKEEQNEYSCSLATIKELETHISSLEDELEQQAQTFEADLATITRERVDQEQRAIRAEEALKLTRWKNSNTAEKLQEEFKRLSKQMASTFEANESVAMKAMEEANEVRIQKIQLEDMVRRAKSELQSVKDDYEEKLVELSNQLNLKTQQVEKLVMEIDDKSKQLERQKQHEEQLGGTSNKKVQKLQDEIEKLVKENNFFSTQVEEMKGSIKNYEELVQNRTTERNELVKSIAVLKKEAEKSAEDLRKMRSIQDEKETTLDLLKAEKSAALAANGTKEVSNLKEKIRLLEMQIRSKETALETSASSFMNKERDLMDKIEELEESVDELNRKCSCSSEETKPKSFNIDDKEFSADELVKELISLKERNEEMGSELLDMQERYSEISLKFAEVEGERQKLVMTVRSLKNNARKEIKQ
ncbi:Laminin-like protein epi-1 [Linum perenne]